jgi:uncharacterized protein (TIGR02001 family)
MKLASLPVVLAGAALLATSAVTAQTAAAPASPHTVTGNFGFVSDYRFRGISQTFKKPAIQGGIDYSHSSGLYLGTWGSNVSGLSYPNGSSLELDVYGGYKFPVGPVTLDLGALHYYYPGAFYSDVDTRPKYNNTELYIGATWGWLSAKYSRSTTDFFGINGSFAGGFCGLTASGDEINACASPLPAGVGSKGSSYVDLTATVPLATGLNLIAHYGKQSVKNMGQLSYSDYKVGVTYDAMGFTWGASYIGTNAKEQFYRASSNSGQTKDLSDKAVVLSVLKTF